MTVLLSMQGSMLLSKRYRLRKEILEKFKAMRNFTPKSNLQ